MKKVEEIVAGFMAYLVSTGQLDLLPQISQKLESLVKEERETAHVVSAVALTSEEEIKVARFLRKKFGKSYRLDVCIDPQIIGGLKVTIGDQVIDQSLFGRLNSLIEELAD